MYTAYVIDDKSRRELKKKFPPKYPDFIGHHVTLRFGVSKDTPKPKAPATVEVVGYKDDGKGAEALVVAINGNTERLDGSTYHITWSIDRSAGRKPVDSNSILMGGFDKVTPISINVTPELLK